MTKEMTLPASAFLHPTFTGRLFSNGQPMRLTRSQEWVKVEEQDSGRSFSVEGDCRLTLEVRS